MFGFSFFIKEWVIVFYFDILVIKISFFFVNIVDEVIDLIFDG